MPYVDGFVVPVPTKNLKAYRSMARKAGKVWKEHGALDYRECVGDELHADPNCASFAQAAGAGEDEVVVFAWILYPSKADRDRINAAVMADPRLAHCEEGVFDMKRMAWGGFRTLVAV